VPQRTGRVWFGSPNQVLPSQWMAAVRKAGYRALPAMDSHAREQRQRESRLALWRWLVAGFCMMQVMMYAWPAYVAQPGDLTRNGAITALGLVGADAAGGVFACGPFFTSALRDIRQRRISMDLPVALGMGITFVVSTAGTFDPSGIFGREVYLRFADHVCLLSADRALAGAAPARPHGRCAGGRAEPPARQRGAAGRRWRLCTRGRPCGGWWGTTIACAAGRGVSGRWLHYAKATPRPMKPC
jgi:hypothetical protein